jgi:hypothetical protein
MHGFPSSLLQPRLALPSAPSMWNPMVASFGQNGGTSSQADLLLAVAKKERLLLEQARNSYLRNELNARVQQQIAGGGMDTAASAGYQGLLSRRFAEMSNDGSSFLLSQGPPSNLNFTSLPGSSPSTPTSNGVTGKAAASKALQVLGSNLRQATDPYVDVSFLEDPSLEDSQVKKTRGGVTEPFPVR